MPHYDFVISVSAKNHLKLLTAKKAAQVTVRLHLWDYQPLEKKYLSGQN